MEVREINKALLALDASSSVDFLSHLKIFRQLDYKFTFDFGLDDLPKEAGIILIRGPRQYGKSTWLELQIEKTVKKYGSGSALYLNGDYLRNEDELQREILTLSEIFPKGRSVKRLFIDEITSVRGWEFVLKRLADSGNLQQILVVTTGSKAHDLRRGIEKLPGRKGRLKRSNFIFTPISYKEFKRVCGDDLGEDILPAYLLSGGSPIACAEVAKTKALPEFVFDLVLDWLMGAFAESGRSRGSALGVLQALFRFAPNPLGQAKLARETGLASNTLAQGYMDIFGDLLCVLPSFAKDLEKNIVLRRKPCKFHFVNLLAAISCHPAHPTSLTEIKALPPTEQGKLLEWIVAQELWRRRCIAQTFPLDELHFWSSKEHEIDFVEDDRLIEVKLGPTHALEFDWFLKIFPNRNLLVVSASRYQTKRIIGQTLEDFLLRD